MGRSAVDGVSAVHALGGRLVLLCTAVLLVVMPWTEYFWHFDRFLQGGQDLELSLLCLASVFCMVLVFSQRRKQNVELALAMQRWLCLIFRDPRLIAQGNLRMWMTTYLCEIPLPERPLEDYCLPIRI